MYIFFYIISVYYGWLSCKLRNYQPASKLSAGLKIISRLQNALHYIISWSGIWLLSSKRSICTSIIKHIYIIAGTILIHTVWHRLESRLSELGFLVKKSLQFRLKIKKFTVILNFPFIIYVWGTSGSLPVLYATRKRKLSTFCFTFKLFTKAC